MFVPGIVASTGSSIVMSLPTLGHYKLDETTGNVLDASTNPVSGSASNVTRGTTALINDSGNSNTFNGTNSNIGIPSNNKYDNIRTISLWVSIDSFTGNPMIAGRHSNGGSRDGWGLWISGGSSTMFFFANDSDSGVGSITVGASLATSTTYHVAVTFGYGLGDDITSYLNGVEQATTTASEPWGYNNQNIAIGEGIDTFWDNFDGVLDDIRFYDTALTATQVLALYNESKI